MMSSYVLFCLQPHDIQLTVIDERRNQSIMTLKELESKNFNFYFLRQILIFEKVNAGGCETQTFSVRGECVKCDSD